MEISTGLVAGRDPATDPIYQGRAAAAAVVHTSVEDRYYHEEVVVNTGPKNARNAEKVRIKIPYDQAYAFVRYDENPAFHDRDELEWEAIARNALEKFAAVKGVTMKSDVHKEANTRYNYRVEYHLPITYRPETLVTLKALREEREAAEAKRARAAEIRSLMAADNMSAY